MAVLAIQVTVPASGSAVQVFTSTALNSNQLSIRNTGSVAVLLGPPGNELFPLNVGEYLGIQVATDDTLWAQVSSGSTAGQITILGMG